MQIGLSLTEYSTRNEAETVKDRLHGRVRRYASLIILTIPYFIPKFEYGKPRIPPGFLSFLSGSSFFLSFLTFGVWPTFWTPPINVVSTRFRDYGESKPWENTNLF